MDVKHHLHWSDFLGVDPGILCPPLAATGVGCPGIHCSAGRMQEWGMWAVALGQMSKRQSAPITVDLDCSCCQKWRLSWPCYLWPQTRGINIGGWWHGSSEGMDLCLPFPGSWQGEPAVRCGAVGLNTVSLQRNLRPLASASWRTPALW